MPDVLWLLIAVVLIKNSLYSALKRCVYFKTALCYAVAQKRNRDRRIAFYILLFCDYLLHNFHKNHLF